MKPAGDERRIGIVLTGGGAKGAYQIGCLRALEEAGLSKVHAIAGTSVGAIHGFMLPAGKLDEAEEIWRRARFTDVAEITLWRLRLLPLWLAAAAGSEFSPFKVWRFADSVTHPSKWRRLLYPVACLATAVGLAGVARTAPGGAPRVVASTFAIVFAVSAVLATLHRRLRPYFLGASPISHGPLAVMLERAITEDDLARVRATDIPVYGTKSTFMPYAPESVPWGGWAPRYIRLDRLSRAELLDTLVTGSGLPGFSSPPVRRAVTVVDGAWTDNVPIAPLLYERAADLDLIIVIGLRQRIRLSPRHNSLLRVIARLAQKALGGHGTGVADFERWADARWRAAGNRAPDARPDPPRIVTVSPSERVGNFFTGTLWFSPPQTARLITLGYHDMRRALSTLESDAVAQTTGSVGRDVAIDPAIG
ncbi:MAG: patatin-like phospholipase family protein [Vicinamibacterales bacterium]